MDIDALIVTLDDAVDAARALTPSREIALAITHMQTARLWLQEAVRASTRVVGHPR